MIIFIYFFSVRLFRWLVLRRCFCLRKVLTNFLCCFNSVFHHGTDLGFCVDDRFGVELIKASFIDVVIKVSNLSISTVVPLSVNLRFKVFGGLQSWVDKKWCHSQTLTDECFIFDYPSNFEGL